MFPIPFNFPFRKKDGSIISLSKAIEDGGSYTLPTASTTTKGGVKIGAGLTMDGETLKNTNPTPYSLPTASAETLGGVKVGSGLAIDDGVLSATGGGGGKIYYKTFNNTNSAPSQIGTSGLYKARVSNIAVEGYTPIGVSVSDTYTSYSLNCGLSTEWLSQSEPNAPCIEIYTTYHGSSTDFAKPITVYYVPNSNIEQIPT